MLSKVLLILVLFNASTGEIGTGAKVFDTMKECQQARIELLVSKKAVSATYYVLTCEKAKPTFTVQG